MILPSEEHQLKNGITCRIRSSVKEDAEKFMEYRKIINSETDFLIRYPEEVNFSIEQVEKFLKEYSEDEKKVLIFAFLNGEIAGSISLSDVSNMMKLKHRSNFGVTVRKKYWNLGIGNLLIIRMLQIAKDTGYEQVELGVFENNENAIRIYKKIGFEGWGRVHRAFKLKNGNYYDEIIMGIML